MMTLNRIGTRHPGVSVSSSCSGVAERGARVRLFYLLEDGSDEYQAVLALVSAPVSVLSAVASSAAASLPRMKARRIGLITNSAIRAAVAFSATAITNTACQ